MTFKTVTVEVEVDLSDIDTEDLIEELESRNADPAPGEDMNGVFFSASLVAWLRDSDPPQEVRDAYYSTYGRMLL